MSATIGGLISVLKQEKREVPRITIQRLAEMIRKAAREDEHMSIVLIGKRGSGKTAFSLHLGKEVYGSYEEALKNLYLPTMIKDLSRRVISTLQEDKVIPMVIMDDAGNSFMKYGGTTREVRHWFRLVNLMRGAIACVVYTDVASIHKYLRSTSNYRGLVRVKFEEEEKKWSLVRLYEVRFNVFLDESVKPIAEIKYETRYPDHIYAKYKRMRNQITLDEWKVFAEEELADGNAEPSTVTQEEFCNLARRYRIKAEDRKLRALYKHIFGGNGNA
jgi:hypothetical protein